MTPLLDAVLKGHLQCVEFLLGRGADATVVDLVRRFCHLFQRSPAKDLTALVLFLRKGPCAAHGVTGWGYRCSPGRALQKLQTVISAAATRGRADERQRSQQGAQQNGRACRGCLILLWPAEIQVRLSLWFLLCGAQNGSLPLEIAVRALSVDVAAVLLKNGADPNLADVVRTGLPDRDPLTS